jgi:hypothetical protein
MFDCIYNSVLLLVSNLIVLDYVCLLSIMLNIVEEIFDYLFKELIPSFVVLTDIDKLF